LSAVLRSLASHGRGSLGMEINTLLQNQDLPLVLVGTYVVLCLPFTFRSIDAGLSTLPLRTLYESSSILGAGLWTALWRAVLPHAPRLRARRVAAAQRPPRVPRGAAQHELARADPSLRPGHPPRLAAAARGDHQRAALPPPDDSRRVRARTIPVGSRDLMSTT